MKITSTIVAILIAFSLSAQDKRNAQVLKMLPEVLKEHREFASMPNVASDSAGIYKNLKWIAGAFEERGFQTEQLPSTTLPIFFAEKKADKPNAQTLLLYMHLDGQPVDASKWEQEDPFTPVLKRQNEEGAWESLSWDRINGEINPDWRVFGRATADDKAPIMMLLASMDLLKQEGTPLSFNLKVILDCQEEAGSDAFLSTIEQYKERYKADYMLIMDGPAHASNRPTLTFGCRGISIATLTVYGSKLPQHSGHFGNYAPNPVFSLSHLLASMKDEDGRVTIEGYYDGIEMGEKTQQMLAQVPDDEGAMLKKLGLKQAEKVGANYQEAMQYPSLNIRQIETSWKGPGLKTVIPEYVTAHIDVRLALETDGTAQLEKIRKHIEKQGYLVLDRAPTDEERLGNSKIATFIGKPWVNAFRTDMKDPFAQQLSNVISKNVGVEPVKIRTMGGTVPIIAAVKALDTPALVMPLVNMDNNQHNPNENIRIGNIIQGIKVCAAVFSM